jgi:hypothetical protein
MADKETDTSEKRLSRADLEDKFRRLQDDLQGRIADKKESIVGAIAVGGVVVFVVAYLLGRRAGRRRRRNIEFRGF